MRLWTYANRNAYRLGRELEHYSRSMCTHEVVPAYGFLPGREVKEAQAGNLGLQDRE